MSPFSNATLLITGGTGSFGNTVLKHFLTTDIGQIRIFSRDEKKQDDMRHELQSRYPEHAAGKVKFYIGDVRDIQSVRDAMPGVDYIFHAAALKQVPSCEFFPMEAVADQHHRHRQRAACGHGSGRTARRLPVYGQGGLSHQFHGHFQGHDGACDLCQCPGGRGAGQYGDLLHPLRQCHVQPRFGQSSRCSSNRSAPDIRSLLPIRR